MLIQKFGLFLRDCALGFSKKDTKCQGISLTQERNTKSFSFNKKKKYKIHLIQYNIIIIVLKYGYTTGLENIK